MMAALLLAACGHRASTGTDGTDSLTIGTDSTATADSTGLQTANLVRLKEDTAVSVRVSIDWPTADNSPLAKAIRTYICEEMALSPIQEDKPAVKQYADGQQAVDTTASQQYQQLKAMRREVREEGIADNMQYSYSLQIEKQEETDRYVTYITNSEGFTGGAHGFATSTGMTFRKDDGKRIGYKTAFNEETLSYDIKEQTLFSSNESAQLYAIIKEGVRSYFQEFEEQPISDAQLKDMLLDVSSVDSIPLPSYPPTFTAKGLSFVYQQYHIAPYAAGMVNFNVPYDKIRPLLTKDARQLLK